MELSAIHLLLKHFLAFLLVIVVFRAFVSPVSCVPTFGAPSFFHQLVLFFNRQSVDIHRIWITFLSGEVILLLRGSLLPRVLSGSFYYSIHLVKSVVECSCPFVVVKQKRRPDQGLNPGPSRHIPDALTTELSGLTRQVFLTC
jgi:hypothetical protein